MILSLTGVDEDSIARDSALTAEGLEPMKSQILAYLAAKGGADLEENARKIMVAKSVALVLGFRRSELTWACATGLRLC